MQALDFYVNTINALIGEGEIKEAIDQLLKLNKAANLDMDGTLINLKGQYNRLRRETDGGYIDRRDAHIYMNRIQLAISNLLEDVPRKIELQQKLNGTTGYDFTVETNDTFEKIIGSQDNLLKISWLEQAITAAKSVCLIVGANGSKGTGFMTADNYLITNNHVIPNRAFARSAYITFNFEEDVLGRAKTSHQYRLDADDFITSDREALDITRVRVKENPDAHPLSFWGHLVFHPDIPAPRTPVTIIQHPEGKVKRIALQANEVVGNKAQYLFYTTDTLAGSSGSPVFDRDWRVVAVHHAGSSFNNRPANRGILARPILHFLAGQSDHFSTRDTADYSSREQQPATAIFKENNRTKLFLAYDKNEDAAAAAQLKKHLSPSIHITKEIDLFDMHEDERLGFGNTQVVIQQAVQASDYVLALVSPSFFVQSYTLVEKAHQAGQTVIPILIRTTDFFVPSFLGGLRSLPTDGQFISEWKNEDNAYTDVARQIRLLHRRNNNA